MFWARKKEAEPTPAQKQAPVPARPAPQPQRSANPNQPPAPAPSGVAGARQPQSPPARQPADQRQQQASPLPGQPVKNAQAPHSAVETPSEPVSHDMLPQLLVSQGHVTVEQIQNALRKAAETGDFFGDILAEEGILDETSLVSFLTKYCRIPHLSLLDYLIDKSVLPLIPAEICWKYHLLPVDKLGRNLTVAMVNPLNKEALNVIRGLCPDLRIKPILCSHHHFDTVAGRLLGEQENHDQQSWAQLPFSPARQTIDELPEEEPTQPTTLPVESITRQEEEVEEAPLDSDSLLDSVFHGVAPAAPEEKNGEQPDIELHSLVDVMRQYTGAMVDSMRDTYALLTRKVPFFKGLFPEDVAKIFAQGNVIEYEPGQTIFNKGDTGENMYIILSGRVEIRDGYKRIAVLHKGDIFGEMALVSDETRSAAALTMTSSSLLSLSFEDIRVNMLPQVAIQLLVNMVITLSQRLRIANEE